MHDHLPYTFTPLTNCSTGIGSIRCHRIAIQGNARLTPLHRTTSDALMEHDTGEEVSQVLDLIILSALPPYIKQSDWSVMSY